MWYMMPVYPLDHQSQLKQADVTVKKTLKISRLSKDNDEKMNRGGKSCKYLPLLIQTEEANLVTEPFEWIWGAACRGATHSSHGNRRAKPYVNFN